MSEKKLETAGPDGGSSRFAAVKEFVLAVARKAGQDNLPRLASSFSFFALLSITPFLVLAVTIAALFLGRNEAAQHIINQAADIGGHQVSEFVKSAIESARRPASGAIAAILSLGVTFFSASNLFLNLDDGINGIWQVKSSGSFVKSYIVTRILAFFSVLIFGAILLGWLILDTSLGYAAKEHAQFPGWQIVSFLATVAFFTLGFSVSLQALPRHQLRWKDALPGAFVTALGFAISKFLLTYYFQRLSGVYTAAGGIVVTLLWMYYSTIIYFVGVEITFVYSHQYGSLKGSAKPETEMVANPSLQASQVS